MSIFDYNAATNAAATPINPPKPATIVGAAFFDADAAELELPDELAAEELDFEALEDALLLVEGALVVAGTLVVTAVTEVVETGIVELVVTTAALEECDEAVVTADAEARDAEYAEHSPRPTEAASCRSDWLHAERRHVATTFWMEEKPEPHWQPSSLSWQPATEIALVRQGTWGGRALVTA